MKGIVITLLALTGICAWAQQPTPEPEVRSASIAVSVASSAGEPIEGAAIRLFGVVRTERGFGPSAPPQSVVSDAEGHYLFEGLTPGDYMMQVQHPDFVPTTYGATETTVRPEPFTLAPGQKLEAALRLSPAGSVSGRVTDEEGNPIAGYRARVERVAYYDGIRRLGPVAVAVTNDNGEYLVENVPPGRFYIRVSFLPTWNFNERQPKRALKPGEADVQLNETMWIRAPDLSTASAFTVGVGEDVEGIDIKMLEYVYRDVKGKVIGLDYPLEEARIIRLPREPGSGLPWSFGVDVQPDGTFEIPSMFPGPYTLALYTLRDGVFGWTPIEVGNRPVDNVVINAQIGEIPGSVVFEGERELTGDEEKRMTALSVSLFATEGPSVIEKRALVEAAGGFTIKQVPPGHYRTQVLGIPEGSYLKEVRLAGVPVLASGLDLTGGVRDGKMDVVISTDAASLTGVVRDAEDKAVPGAEVTLVPVVRKFQQSRLYPRAVADESGAFQIQGITPGRYEVFAWETIEDTAHWDDKFINVFATRGEEVELEAKMPKNLNLTVIPEVFMNDALMRAGF